MKSKLSISAISVVLCLIASECFVRFLGFHGIDPTFQPVEFSPDLGWKLKPNFVSRWKDLEWNVDYRTNDLGFRDSPRTFHRQGTGQRILVLGDSNGEGWGVEVGDRWVEIAAHEFKTRGKQVELIPLAVRGYDILQELRLYDQIGFRFEIDMVVQILNPNDWGFGGETIMDQYRRFRPSFRLTSEGIEWRTVDAPPEVRIGTTDRFTDLKRLLYRSALISLATRVLGRMSLWDLFLQKAGARNPLPTIPEQDEYGEHYKEAVRRVYRSFLKRGIPFAVVWLDHSAKSIPPDLKALFGDLSIPVLELELGSRERFRMDPHANKIGHHLIGIRTAEFLADRLPPHP